MRLSQNRANAVARVAQSTGARIADVRAYGERQPAVPNTSAANMAKNRRVEIICLRYGDGHMKLVKGILLLTLGAGIAACDKVDKTVDRGFDSKDLSQLQAGIWVDPNGCDHWIIDDGFEGYLSQRLDKYGKPVCSGVAPPGTAVGPYKKSSSIEDLI